MFDVLMELDRVTLHDTESPVRWVGDDLLDLRLADDVRTYAFPLTASTAPTSSAKSTRDILADMRTLSGLPPAKVQAA